MESIRAFIAINIGSEIRARLSEFQEKLKTTDADIRWVKPETMHLTLAFLGNIPVSKIHSLNASLQTQLKDTEAFTIDIQGVGVFGKRKRPSVVWAGIRENAALMDLQQRVVSALGPAEISFVDKPFRPHLTLGRFKTLNRLDELFQLLDKEQDCHFGRLSVDSVRTIKSELKPGGAEHTVLHCISFKS